MNDVNDHLMTIFGEALECASAAELRAHLDRACGRNAQMRGKVEALLHAHAQAGGFLQPSGEPPLCGPEGSPGLPELQGPTDQHSREAPGTVGGLSELQSSTDQNSREAPGTVIGAYKLLE